MHPEIAHGLLDAVVREIAVASVELQGVVGHAERGVGDEALCHGALHRGISGAVIELPRSLAQQGARCLEFRRHVGQPELQGLELIEGGAEGAAFAHVDDTAVEGLLSRTKGDGGKVETATVEPRHRQAKAGAGLAHEVAGVDAAFVHDHVGRGLRPPSHLVFQCAETKAGGAGLDGNAGDASRTRIAGARHDEVEVGKSGAGDEALGAVEHKRFAVFAGARDKGGGIGTAAGFGQAVGGDEIHRHQPREPSCALVR